MSPLQYGSIRQVQSCLLAGIVLLLAQSCASVPSKPTDEISAVALIERPVYDPLERINRPIFRFNEALDNYLLGPLAYGYRAVAPDFVEIGVSNFFSNLNEINVIVNDLLQAKFRQAASDTARFALNTTLGFGGILDPATQAGLVSHNESFGQTFGTWGIGEGPFLVMPVFGPTNLRNLGGMLPETVVTYPAYIDDNKLLTSLQLAELVDTRARFLATGGPEMIEQAGDDKYRFVRELWTRGHRANTLDMADPPQDQSPNR